VTSIVDLADGQVTVVTGTLSALNTRTTKQSRAWASATITVDGDSLELLVFPRAWDQYGPAFTDGATVTVPVRMDRRDGVARLNVLDVAPTNPDGDLAAQIDVLLAEYGVAR
jgi:DNA polymerase-3 subunit alpha